MKRNTHRAAGALLILILCLVNCRTTPDPDRIHAQAAVVLADIKTLMQAGKYSEAARLASTLEDLYPQDPQIATLLQQIEEQDRRAVTNSPWLGFNRSKRAVVEASFMERAIYYVPDRLIDVLEIVSLDIGVGLGVGVGVWVTRAVQIVAYWGTYASVGWFQKRNLAAKVESGFDFAVGPLGATAINGKRIGTGGKDYTERWMLFHYPTAPIYQEYRDYWSIGVRALLPPPLFVGAGVELHLMEVFDFLAGIFFFDPLKDDFATTRGLDYSEQQTESHREFRRLSGGMHLLDRIGFRDTYKAIGAPPEPAPR